MNLRREFTEYKDHQKKITEEAALEWLSNHVIFITEKIDRRSIDRLVKAIQKFEDTFGKFRDRLPAIASSIDSAEQALQLIITGKLSDRKTSDVLKQLSYLYSTFSDFMTRDLPVLLSTKLFDGAKAQPDVRLDMVRPTPEAKFDAMVVRDALANALLPTPDEQKLLNKLYRGSSLPKLEVKKIADQMLQLTYSELEEITQVGKIPAVTTPPPETTAPEAEVPIPATESLQREGAMLLEAWDKQKTDALLAAMEKVKAKLGTHNALKPINDALTNLQAAAQKEAVGWRGLGKRTKQLIMFSDLMSKLKDNWPSVQKLFSDGVTSDEEKASLRKVLQDIASDKLLTKVASLLGTSHFPGLDPESLVKVVMSAVETPEGIEAVKGLFAAAQDAPPPDASGAPQTGGGKATTGTAGTGGTETTKGTEGTTDSQAAAAGTKEEQEAFTQELAQAAKAGNLSVDAVNAIAKNHGYYITKAK